MTNHSDEVTAIVEQLGDHDVEVDQDDVSDRLDTLVTEYSVPITEAKRSVLRHYADEADVELEGTGTSGNKEVNTADITSADQWVTVEATVVQLWDATHDSIKQTGLIGDETGRIKFTSWADNDAPLLEEDETYEFENVVTDEYQGQMSINIQSSSTISQLDRDIEAADNSVTVSGAMVDIQSGSGLIKRCEADDCTRVLQNGRCAEHGKMDGEFDLRIKAVLDDGTEVQNLIFDAEATEDLTGLTLESAKEQAQEALDTTVVAEELTEDLVGRYYEVEGPVMGRYLLVNETRTPDVPSPDDLLASLEASES